MFSSTNCVSFFLMSNSLLLCTITIAAHSSAICRYITEHVLLTVGESWVLVLFLVFVCSSSLCLVWWSGLLSVDFVLFNSCDGELHVEETGENGFGDNEFLEEFRGVTDFGVIYSPVLLSTGIVLIVLKLIRFSASLLPPALDFKFIVNWDSSNRVFACSFLFSSSSCKIYNGKTSCKYVSENIQLM